MSETNGTAAPESAPQGTGLMEALQAHAQAIVSARTRADGRVLIDPMQMLVDLELLNLKVALLLEVLSEIGVSPDLLLTRLRDKVCGETEQIEAEARQARILFASGHAPRKQ